MLDQEEFFRRFGKRVKALRLERERTQEDMIESGFSARHWQQIEAGRAVTMRTVLNICDSFSVNLIDLLQGLESGLNKAKGESRRSRKV